MNFTRTTSSQPTADSVRTIQRHGRLCVFFVRVGGLTAIVAAGMLCGVGGAFATTTGTLTVVSSPVRQGADVKFTGTVTDTAPKLACVDVVLSSSAFSGGGQAGTPAAIVAHIEKNGTYKASARLAENVTLGSYTVTADCSSAAIAITTFDVVPVLPLDHTSHGAAQFLALLVVGGLVLIVFLVTWKKKGTVLTGHDKRISTSKTIALLWTPVVAYILTTLAFIAVASDDFGLWHTLVGSPVGVYLVLLGGPFASLVGAKSIVTSQLANGTVQRAPADRSRVSDVFSTDDGNVDIVDSQYLFFNLVAIVVVLAQFVSRPGFGAPDVPWFLAALTGTSAATYLTNKALISNGPKISGVMPGKARVGETVVAYGTNLTAPAAAETVTRVTVGGVLADAASVKATECQVEFRVPPPATGTAYPVVPQQVVVTTVANATAVLDNALTVVLDSPMPQRVDPTQVRVGDTITVFGQNLVSAADLAVDHSITGDSAAQVMLMPTSGGTGVVCSRPTPPATSDRDSQLTVVVPDTTPAGSYSLSVRGAHNASVLLTVAIPSLSGVAPTMVKPGDPFVVTGALIFRAADLDPRGVPKPHADPQVTLSEAPGSASIACKRIDPPSPTDSATQVMLKTPAASAGTYAVVIAGVSPAALPVSLQITL